MSGPVSCQFVLVCIVVVMVSCGDVAAGTHHHPPLHARRGAYMQAMMSRQIIQIHKFKHTRGMNIHVLCYVNICV